MTLAVFDENAVWTSGSLSSMTSVPSAFVTLR